MKITGLAKKVNRKVTVPTKVESAVPNVPHQPPAGAGTRSVNPAVISQGTNCIARTCYRYSSGGPPHINKRDGIAGNPARKKFNMNRWKSLLPPSPLKKT